MNFYAFARVSALSGFAAAAIAQQTLPAPKPSTSAPAAAPEANVPPDTVVITIGDQKITRAQFDALLKAVAQNGRPPAATAAQRRQVAEQYAELETMAQEARKRKLEDDPEVKQMMAVQTDSFLANALAKQITENTHFTDLDLRAYYDAHKDEFEEAKGSHILIRFKGSSVPLKPNEKDLTPEEALAKAQEIRKKILAGADFAMEAKEESDDAGSASKGGDLGTFRHGQMVGPFDQAAFAIPVGEVSEPVKSAFGYHIIKITSRSTKPFEEAKPLIEKDLKPKLAREALATIKAHTPVTLSEDYFGKPGVTPPPSSTGPSQKLPANAGK